MGLINIFKPQSTFLPPALWLTSAILIIFHLIFFGEWWESNLGLLGIKPVAAEWDKYVTSSLQPPSLYFCFTCERCYMTSINKDSPVMGQSLKEVWVCSVLFRGVDMVSQYIKEDSLSRSSHIKLSNWETGQVFLSPATAFNQSN